MPDNALTDARYKRGQAVLARRLALGLSRAHDRDRLYAFADAKEREASALERQAAANPDASMPPPATQVHQQPQQQQQATLQGRNNKDDPQP